MSQIDCTCPAGDLETISSEDCSTTKQPKFSKIIFQKFLAANAFVDGTNGIDLSTSWTGLFDPPSTDAKCVITPYLSEVTIGEGDVIEGTENYDGAPTADAVTPQTVTAIIENCPPVNAQQMEDLFCQSGNLGVYLLYSNGQIHASTDRNDPTASRNAIRISPDTLVVKAPSREAALGSKYQFMIQFRLPNEWYGESDVVKPEAGFNPNDLAPA